ncbi:MAG: hypothetical protein KME15_17135 [Drouetiella hepatica Uher 2000/2452]|jgi:hypothetical protein|uniref:Uncharacterized protein n=1 Tax=Drouetiella hepatica Uher 2000/2452 TaxID=904376 RepID=A0A951QDB9_9CYAN|nr:hypothetical protein [Drouetiella hepatica Uher 2000/2452]
MASFSNEIFKHQDWLSPPSSLLLNLLERSIAPVGSIAGTCEAIDFHLIDALPNSDRGIIPNNPRCDHTTHRKTPVRASSTWCSPFLRARLAIADAHRRNYRRLATPIAI